MPWNYNTARERIKEAIRDVPAIETKSFIDDYYQTYLTAQTVRATRDEAPSKPLFDLPKNSAILVNTVQLYVNILNYDDYRLQDGRETEASHEKALQFLHFHYSACDRVVGNTKAQRVDFHSARMHAVVLETKSQEVSRESVIEALELAFQLQLLAQEANKELANEGLSARFRIGIDAGPCVAINSGNGKDKEPLFLGGSANRAAKIADGDVEGIFPSDNVRAILGMPILGSLELEKLSAIDEIFYRETLNRELFTEASGQRVSSHERVQNLINEWKDDISKNTDDVVSNPNFSFHYKQPPLSDIDYNDLSPSNSIRMELASIFADLDGYTAYIDEAMRNNDVNNAVRAIHVIRSELQSVLEVDFGGRKIRFIGDCIHGVLAEGSSSETDLVQTATETALCAGALRSSFNLCKEELPGISNLGLAIGAELGETPISRIGIRGERSVRLASSTATIMSEALQQECNDKQTKFGPKALEHLPSNIEDLFDGTGIVNDMDYDDVDIINPEVDAGVLGSPSIVGRSHCVAKK